MSSSISTIMKSNENVVFILNPSITYFKSVYRKYTKFTITYKEEQPNTNSTFETNENINIDLNYYADLLCDISLKVVIDSNGNTFSPSHATGDPHYWPNDIPLFLVNDIKLSMIGPNIELDKLDKDYINFHAMLNNPKSNNSTYNLVNNTLTCNDGNNFQNIALCGGVINSKNLNDPIYNMTSIIPLPFAFSKSIGNAIPLCALNLTNTKPQITLSRINIQTDDHKFVTGDNNDLNNNIISLFNYSIISKYIFLSDEEKLRFRNSKQEYLYERVNVLNNGRALTQVENPMGLIQINRITTNNPIKQIYLYNEVGASAPNFNELKYNITINSEQMFSENLNHEYFSKVEILNKFKGCIYNSINGINGSNTVVDNNIALIDFSLKMSDGPSGCITPSNNTINLTINNENNEFNTKIYVACYYFLSIFNERISYMFE